MIKLLASAAFVIIASSAFAQQTQSGIASEITTQLPSGQQIPIVNLRQVLSDMNLAIFQSQGGGGLVLSGTPTPGQVITSTAPGFAAWSTPSSGAPSGPAGGVLSGNYPNPGFATTPIFSGGAAGGALSGTYPNPTLASPTTVNVALLAGATAGDKIVNCVAALPSTGGVCDARSIPSGGVINGITLGKSGATVLGPCGSFTVNGSIQIYNVAGIDGFQWTGCGKSGTIFNWNGNAGSPLFRIRGVRDTTIESFGIISSPSAPLLVGVQFETADAGLSSARRLRNVRMEGINAGGLTDGVLWCIGGGENVSPSDNTAWCGPQLVTNNTTAGGNAVLHFASVPAYIVPGMFVYDNTRAVITAGTTVLSVGTGIVTMSAGATGGGVLSGDTIVFASGMGGAGNNDVDVIDQVDIHNYSQSALHIMGTQSTQHLFFRVTASADSGLGKNAVLSQGGSWTWIGGGGGNNTAEDFHLSGNEPYVAISSFDFEGSKRLLATGAAGLVVTPVTISGGRWAANNLHADGKVIAYNFRGPLNITGIEIDGVLGGASPTIDISSNGFETGNAVGNKIATASISASYNPFTCASFGAGFCWNLVGNSMLSIDGLTTLPIKNLLKSNGQAGMTVTDLLANYPCNAQNLGNSFFVTNQGTAAAWRGAVSDGGGGGIAQWVTCGAGAAYYQGQ